MRSMTGFGLGTRTLDEGKVTVEIRGVNHRFTDVRVRVPRDIEPLALFMEQLARGRFSRGRFDVSVRLDGHLRGGSPAEVAFDRSRARAVYHALASFRDEVAPGSEVPLSLLAAVPGLFVAEGGGRSPLEPVRRALEGAFEEAAAAFDAMREVEGASLGKDLRARLETVRGALHGIEARLPALVDAHRQRLRERLERLEYRTTPAAAAGLDEGRLERELALLAERADVTEELTRLSSHAAQIEQAIVGRPSRETASGGRGDQQVGRRLDFLLQEMAREANTLGAKSSDAEVAQAVVSAKVEIERMREQVQNVE